MNHRATEGAEDLPDYFNRITHGVIGAAIEVHRHLGPGYLESTYEESLAVELRLRRINFRRQVVMPIEYKGNPVATARFDLLVEELVVVELKAVETVLAVHRAQVISYLKAGCFQLGLLINFNVKVLVDGVSRVICTP